MIDGFKVGHWYRWIGPKELPAGWIDSMSGMLDGKPHLCTYVNVVRKCLEYARFPEVSKVDFLWEDHNCFEECPAPEETKPEQNYHCPVCNIWTDPVNGKCPTCGLSFEPVNPKIKCPYCGNITAIDALEQCEHCGHRFVEPKELDTPKEVKDLFVPTDPDEAIDRWQEHQLEITAEIGSSYGVDLEKVYAGASK